ncbi:MAG: hypothetical protein RJB26_1184 [Pseudomonadota bacterium]
MQLNTCTVASRDTNTLRKRLMLAGCALLGATSAVHAEDTKDWQVDSAVLYYKESGGRVQAIEPVINVKHDFGDEHVLGLKFTYDSLTGGSPTGGVVATSPQTTVSPSGHSRTTIAAGDLPLDSNFKDQRFALDGNWSQPIGNDFKVALGAGFSHERDWTAATANAGVSRDFLQHNLTVNLGVSGEYDRINPVGGVPQALSNASLGLKSGNESRNGVGGQLGFTVVMSRNWLVRANFNYDRSSGYQTDPYKILSVVNADGTVANSLYESRPDKRARKSVYLESRVGLRNDDALSVSYRRMQDDWGIHSDTAEVKYHYAIDDRTYVEPHVRWYQQTAADFYQVMLHSGAAVPTFASADSRLGAFSAPTVGIKVGRTDEDGNELSVRLDYYQQTGKNVAKGPGILAPYNLYPGMKAVMLQVGWRFGL